MPFFTASSKFCLYVSLALPKSRSTEVVFTIFGCSVVNKLVPATVFTALGLWH